MYEAKVLYPADVDTTVAEQDPRAYPLRMLAEGDSWFSFGSWRFHSYLNMMRFSQPTAIVTLANPGQLVTRMADILANPELDHWLSAPWGAFQWNAVLISGGGNDVIDAAKVIIPPNGTLQPVKPAAQYVDGAALAGILAKVRQAYETIVALRDRPISPCIGVPLVTHTYDLVTPRNAPAQFLIPLKGPWLYPAMRAAKIPDTEWNAVSDYILGELARTLISLEAMLPNFHVARTQGTLKRAAPGTTASSNDFENEIHPRRQGYRKLAPIMAQLVESLTL
jgi:hypothetical protein